MLLFVALIIKMAAQSHGLDLTAVNKSCHYNNNSHNPDKWSKERTVTSPLRSHRHHFMKTRLSVFRRRLSEQEITRDRIPLAPPTSLQVSKIFPVAKMISSKTFWYHFPKHNDLLWWWCRQRNTSSLPPCFWNFWCRCKFEWIDTNLTKF